MKKKTISLTSSSLEEVGGVGAEPPHRKLSTATMPVKRFFLYNRQTKTGLEVYLQAPRFRHSRGDRKKAQCQGVKGGDFFERSDPLGSKKYYPYLDVEPVERRVNQDTIVLRIENTTGYCLTNL